MVEVRQARYFAAVAEELHFGRAAERLNMSQPPLSQAILALERQLGVKLLRRTSRQVLLTEAGRLFMEQCRVLIQSSERARTVAVQANAGVVGMLRIGAVTSAFHEPLPRILEIFRHSRPLVDLQVSEIDTHQGRSALLDTTLDVAVIRQAVSDRQLASVPLRRDRFVLAMHSQQQPMSESPVALADYRHASWIWLPRHISPDYHDELGAACRHAGFRPEPNHYANSIDSQLAMVACGLGVTLVPETSARQYRGVVAWRALREPVDLVELALVSRAGQNEPLVEHFVQCAAQAVGESAAART